jgi:DNA-binding beta-propeller fold protein YncE
MINMKKIKPFLIASGSSLTRAVSIAGLLLPLVFSSCRKDPQPIPETPKNIIPPDPSAAPKGFFLLNEGNMNSNKASLDYMDYTTGIYTLNLYNQRNPSVTKGLGDVGNDIGTYGSKVYVVVNNSNKVEILDKMTGVRITQVNIINCRSVAFSGTKAYVSAYLGKVGDPNAPNGIVAEIDTTSLTITRKVTVGRQPEQIAIVGQKLYVANSGGYSPPNYERTVSVIDLVSFTQIKLIDVAINLDRCIADKYGKLYVTSRGDYYTTPSDLYVIDTRNDSVVKNFNLPASNLWIDNDLAYIYATDFNYNTRKTMISYSMIDVSADTLLNRSFITDGTDQQIKVPYGIAVNPVTKEVLVTDAKDYVNPGTLYCFDSSGKKLWSTTTGDIPGHFAFVY